MFTSTIKNVLGGENDKKQSRSRAIATIRSGIIHPSYLKNSGADIKTYAKAMVILLQSVLYEWTNLAAFYPYNMRKYFIFYFCLERICTCNSFSL